MEDALDSLDRKKYPNTAISFELENGDEVFYMRRVFNHDYYDSLVFYGRLDEIKSSLIQPIQDIFSTIKGHNEYLTRAMTIEDINLDTPVPLAAITYFIWMDKHEKIILKTIPEIIKKLQD